MTTRREIWAGSIFEAGVTRPLLVLTAAVGLGSLLGALRAAVLLAMSEEVLVDLDDPSDDFETWAQEIARGYGGVA